MPTPPPPLAHRWKKGECPNPNGRPRLTPAQRVEREALRRVGLEHEEKLREGVILARQYSTVAIKNLIRLATSADEVVALRANSELLNRSLWPSDPSHLALPVPGLGTGSVSERAASIVASVSEGKLSAHQGMSLLQVLGLAADASLNEEFVQKLSRLKELLARRGLERLVPEVPTLVPPYAEAENEQSS
jgi:Family of unknown function (DUF5681)